MVESGYQLTNYHLTLFSSAHCFGFMAQTYHPAALSLLSQCCFRPQQVAAVSSKL